MQKLADGTQLGAYTIVRRIGRGGMGEVYEAHEGRLDRRVALKVIAPQKAGDYGEVDLVRRFLQEAKTLAQVNHPNVVTIYSIDNVSGTQFIAMEFVDGALLKDFFSLFALSGDEASSIFMQMLEGLRTLHESKILHRDLKPHNIMLRPNGQVKILDFGIAKRLNDRNHEATSVGVVIGTLSYLPPEVLHGVAANERSDLWSLGAIFYECLVGQPLVGNHSVKIKGVRASQNSDVVFPNECLKWIPEELRRIVGRMCDSKPENRYVNAAEAIEDLRRFQLGRPPLPPTFSRSFQSALENIVELKNRMRKKMPEDSKAKRALWLSLMDGRVPTGNTEPVLDRSQFSEEMPSHYTQVVRDSVSARHRAKRRARRKQEPWYSQLTVPALIVVMLALGFLLYRNYSARQAPVVRAEPVIPLKLVLPAEKQALWLPPAQMPLFSWSRVVNSGEFVLQVAWDPEFNTVVVNEAVSGNSHRLTHALNEGEYFWRLWPLAGGQAPTPVHFSLAVLSAPELQQPAANQVFEPQEKKAEINFAWSCKPGGEKYHVQISTDNQFSKLIEDHVGPTCAWLNVKLENGNYFWRVQTEEPAPGRGLWSAARSFQIKGNVLPAIATKPAVAVPAPVPVERPQISKTVAPPRLKNAKHSFLLKFKGKNLARDVASVRKQIEEVPTFSWSPVMGAKKYSLQISHSPDFSRLVADEIVAATSYQWKEVAPGRVFWRVKAYEAKAVFSERGELEVRLPAPNLTTDFTIDEHGTLAWLPVPMVDHYVVQSSPQRNLAGNVEQLTPRPEVTLKVTDKTQYVRVAAASSSGEPLSEFSQIATIEGESGPPQLQLKTPRDGAHVRLGGSGRITVIFSWVPSPEAVEYEIQVASEPEFKNVIEHKALKTHHSVMREAELSGIIYWRVRGIGAKGPGPWSVVSTFEVQ